MRDTWRDSGETAPLRPRVGVLALQGDFARHLSALELAGAEPVEVRNTAQLESCDALIIPGGESSTISWLLDRFAMREPLMRFVAGHPVWGTCAGLILLANEIVDSAESKGVKVAPLGALDVSVARNAYGRQVHSFEDTLQVTDGEISFTCPASFIRAPRITRVGEGVTVLAEHNGSPALVKAGHLLGGTFHSELHDNPALTQYFVEQFVRPALLNVGDETSKQTDKNVA